MARKKYFCFWTMRFRDFIYPEDQKKATAAIRKKCGVYIRENTKIAQRGC